MADAVQSVSVCPPREGEESGLAFGCVHMSAWRHV